MSWQVRDSREVSRTIGESDIYLFAGITDDLNPMHVAQSIKFLAPVAIGDATTARAEVIEITEIDGRRRMRLQTTVKNQRSEFVIEGEATVKPPS